MEYLLFIFRCKYSNCNTSELSKFDLNTTLDNKCHRYNLLDDNGTCTEENFDISTVRDCDEWVYENTHSFVAEVSL